MRILTCLFEQHDLRLVLLAAIICLAGSGVTARLYAKARESEARARPAWLFMGAVAAGANIWCTHFVGMLAYRPGAEVAYEPVLTGASLLVAIVGCAVAMGLGSARFRHAPAAGGAVFGAAVSAMHYTGMAAFTTQAAVDWAPAYVAASVAAALSGGACAFVLAARSDHRGAGVHATLMLVATIVALHFTGMAAMAILPFAPADGSLNGHDAASLLAVGIAGVGFLILGTAVASHALEEQTARVSRDRLHSLIEGSVDGMLVESEGRILLANAAFVALCEAEKVAGDAVQAWLQGAAEMPDGELVQTSLTTSGGIAVPVEVAVRRHVSEARTVRILAVRDLRPRLAQERRIAHLARNDSLTGLPNRTSFLEKLERMAQAERAAFALLAIDLDKFKEVNDLYGHAVGDRMLRHVAEQMKAALREGEFLARLGGDEFVVLAPVAEREGALELAERLRAAIVAPVRAEHADLRCGASIGVACWPADAAETSLLINNADLAMYRAKASVADHVCFYEEAMDEAVRRRRRITQELREALENDRFELHYQLQALVETGEVTGYEALLRWRRPDGVFVPPAEFIPLAEETGMILPIGEWVLRRACEDAAAWSLPHRVAVNLSPVQLSHVDLPRLVHQVLLETGLPASRLELEITETAMITDPDRTTHILRQLKALGVSVAMDDFGTGYSSLSTLRAFPFDKIKLDRSFMAELGGGPQSQAIIRAVLTIGESLRIPVLAEGVETEEHLQFLREQGCTEAQGFLLGRPAPLRQEVQVKVAAA